MKTSPARALVLERKLHLAVRDIDLASEMGPEDVRIRITTVGICGSDVHWYQGGPIDRQGVERPMVLGHEASGVVEEVGAKVTTLKAGDRVCMEPGIPNFRSRETMMGRYNLDRNVAFWATPPVHGCLTRHVVHPTAFTFKVPDHVSHAEAAMVEPLAVGVYAAGLADIKPGDVAVVTGAGPIGVMTALAARVAGCSKVIISDVQGPKLELAARYDGLVPVNIRTHDLKEVVAAHTDGWGAKVLIEASGHASAYEGLFELLRPGGLCLAVGIPRQPVPFTILPMLRKELRFATVYRYANVFAPTLDLIASGKIDLKPLVTGTFDFEQSIAAFERAAEGRPEDVKLQILLGD
jgi:D-xylulose reductase